MSITWKVVCRNSLHYISGHYAAGMFYFLFFKFVLSIGTVGCCIMSWHLSSKRLSNLCLGNVKLISCLVLHGKRFCFHWKKADARKGMFFLFYQIVMETIFLWKNLSGKSLQSKFHWFQDENIVHLVFKFVLNTYRSGWSTTHST